MPFPRSDRTFKPARDGAPVLAVGRQAFINGAGERRSDVALVDERGAAVLGSLLDGAEVEIVAWEPRGSATRYFVRSTGRELMGWLGASQLRTTREPAGAVAPAPPIAAVWIPPRQPRERAGEIEKQSARRASRGKRRSDPLASGGSGRG